MLDDVQKAARDQFEKQSKNYGKSHILASTDDIAAVLEGIYFPEQAKALDVATGGGHTAAFLAERGFSVTASDISAGMLDVATKLALDKGHFIKTVLHTAEEFPYEDESFDLVSCRVAAHHFSDREAFLRETFRVLKPGGYFFSSTGAYPMESLRPEEWIHQIEKFGTQPWPLSFPKGLVDSL